MADLISQIQANAAIIKKLKETNDELTWKYVHMKASEPSLISKTLGNISDYLGKYYDSYSEFIELCKANLTMTPMCQSIFGIDSKRNIRIKYDTILYEWKGKRVMYVRASKNCDMYHKDCNYWNGFNFDAFDDVEFPCETWWKTETDFLLMDHIEYQIELTAHKRPKTSFADHVRGIRDQYKLIAALFDQSDYSHALLGSGYVPDVYSFTPDLLAVTMGKLAAP
jgi:hypothetical protein